jgi:aryl-alcohol dehydrogenase-like predicted oxidoreductase
MTPGPLGHSGLRIAPLVFGGNVFGWTVDEKNSYRLLDACLDGGINMIDTADTYSRWVEGNTGGESETIIGNWLEKSGKRAQVLIATKAGNEMGEGRMGLSRAYLFEAVEASLKRLRTSYIDLYQAHRDDPGTPLEETLGAFTDLVKAGKVRAIGASNYKAPRLAQALEVSRQNGFARFESLQPWYNLYDRAEFEGPTQELCRDEGLGVISYFSLARGFLTGKYRTEADLAGSARRSGVRTMMNPRGMRILAALDAIAQRIGATPAQVALAWVRGRGLTAPIASATTPVQLEELIGSMHIQLDAEAMQQLDAASVGAEPRHPR